MLVSVEPRFPPLTLAKASGADPGAPRHLSQPSFRFLQKSPPFEYVQRTGLVISAREPPFRFLQKSPPFENVKRTGLVISANAWGFCREYLFCLLQTLVAFAENVVGAVFTSNVCDICRNYSSSPLSRYFRSLWYLQKPPRSSFGHLQKL